MISRSIDQDKDYHYIDIAKYLFACLIPLLHIPFSDSLPIDILRQYCARIGVPFFFAATGFLLAERFDDNNRFLILKKQLFRIGILFVVWLGFYLIPIYYLDDGFRAQPIRTILFKTPAYLWYLASVMFALVPFCFIKNRIIKVVCAVLLYLVGTLLSETYSWMTFDIPLYDQWFLTYRNGLFFAFPVMCVGEITHLKRARSKDAIIGLAISYALFSTEVFLVRRIIGGKSDTSMTLFLPCVVFFLLSILIDIPMKPRIYRSWMRRASTAIYVMQFTFIFLGKVIVKFFGNYTLLWIVVYIALIVLPTVLTIKLGNKSIIKYMF